MTAATAVAESTTLGMYATYITIAVGLVIWLGKTLQKNGGIFLEDVFESDEMGKAVNHLLVVGFYLLNTGYAVLIYRLNATYATTTEAVSEVVFRLGLLVLSLGVIHLFNMLVFWRIRNHRNNTVPIPSPARFMPPPPASTVSPTN